MAAYAQGTVALALGLVIAAGACTCLGAALVFCSSAANHRLLSGALGVSAGVMVYVSFVEIFCSKAIQAFEEAGHDGNAAARYATFCFFAGCLLTWLLDRLVHALMHLSDAAAARRRAAAARGAAATAATAAAGGPQERAVAATAASTAAQQLAPRPASAASGSSGSNPAGDADVEIGLVSVSAGNSTHKPLGDGFATGSGFATSAVSDTTAPADAPSRQSCQRPPAPDAGAGAAGALAAGCQTCDGGSRCPHGPPVAIPKGESPEMARVLQADHHAALARTGMLAALAILIHNLPEGLATFVSTLASPTTGLAMAVAISLHNLPEGVVVAMPIYYATGSKWKGFLWSCISGAAEPIGGLIGYALLSAHGGPAPPLMFAVTYGAVAGMMVFIAMRELLPTALRYDPEDRYATLGFFGGAAVMAASLLLFRV